MPNEQRKTHAHQGSEQVKQQAPYLKGSFQHLASAMQPNQVHQAFEALDASGLSNPLESYMQLAKGFLMVVGSIDFEVMLDEHGHLPFQNWVNEYSKMMEFYKQLHNIGNTLK